ncbi:MAG: adenylyl-sulfate reductase subunit beta [Pseudodesulfovibrio sp.]
MPTFVNPEKCDGCKGGEKTACMYICPNDLMILDADEMKAYNQEPAACWECYSCVKICPQGAIEARPYADFVPLGGTSIPMRSAEDIMWTIKFRNGSVKRFKFPIRTTPEGSIKPFEGKPEPTDLENELLFTETELANPIATSMTESPIEDAGKTKEWKQEDYGTLV